MGQFSSRACVLMAPVHRAMAQTSFAGGGGGGFITAMPTCTTGRSGVIGPHAHGNVVRQVAEN